MHVTVFHRWALGLALVALTCPALHGQEKDAAKKPADSAQAKTKATAKKAATHEIKRERFRIELKLKGHLAPVEAHEISLRPRAWSTLKVREVVPHGSVVRQGDVILRLETEKLEKQLDELRRQLRQSELNLQLARIQDEIGDRSREIERRSARRNAQSQQNELEYYLEVGRELEEQYAKFALRSAEYSLEYAKEELRQLRKMYEADELTEESEEIVLKRAERAVESAEFFLHRTRLNTERQLTFNIPLQTEQMKDAAQQSRLALETKERTRELSERLRRLQRENRERSHHKLEEQLEDYERDLEMMTVRAPFDGVVYYGSFNRGRSSDALSAAARLRPGSQLVAGSVVLTVAAPRPLRVDVEVAEGDLYRVKFGQTCVITPTAFPRRRVEGHLKSVSQVPLKPGTFTAGVAIGSIPDDLPLMPGMAATVTVRVYDNAQAITVPAGAVKEIDGQEFVWIDQGDKPPLRRAVETGHRTKEKIEIVGGLKGGEKILAKAAE